MAEYYKKKLIIYIYIWSPVYELQIAIVLKTFYLRSIAQVPLIWFTFWCIKILLKSIRHVNILYFYNISCLSFVLIHSQLSNHNINNINTTKLILNVAFSVNVKQRFIQSNFFFLYTVQGRNFYDIGCNIIFMYFIIMRTY